ncbi:putative RNA-directed DNA polymerase, eukaryota, reverse transcriptase zinc-binding domain protein [Tanacetum coccineum]
MPIGSKSSFITLIPKVLANRLSKVVDKLISHEQSTFIKSRQILDGPLFLSEAIDWYKKRKKKMLLFKVDFEKAFDSVSWRYLDYMSCNLGFGLSWRSWIKACLESSRTSILINGSPTFEFNVRRGLRQGDPLSPFLFIIIMEGLHVALTNSVRSGLIRGINFVVSVEERDDRCECIQWNVHDLDNVIRIFQVFFLASGLKINVHKSSIYGIGVASDDVQIMAANTGCSAGTLPLTYLSLPIGSNMSLFVNWKPLVDKFRLKLSNLLSYGGRLTLIKAVLGSLGIYFFSLFKAPVAVLKALESAHSSFFGGGGGSTDSKKLSWVKWSNVFASLDKGVLAIGSLNSFNFSLLHKWRWRFFASPDSLWLKLLKRCMVGYGSLVRFWKDIWLGNSPLYTRFARLFRLEQDKDCLVMDRISNGQWSWNWSRDNIGIGNSSFLNNLLEEISHIELNRLPLRLNLSSRGIEIPEISCPLCNGNVESNTHIFYECTFAKEIWRTTRMWCEDSFPLFESNDHWIDWLISWPASCDKKHRVFVIIAASLWFIWRYRNDVTFSSHSLKKSDVFDFIRLYSFSWLKHRGRMSCSWNDWLKSPL